MQIIGCDLHARQQTIAILDTGSVVTLAPQEGMYGRVTRQSRETHCRTLPAGSYTS